MEVGMSLFFKTVEQECYQPSVTKLQRFETEEEAQEFLDLIDKSLYPPYPFAVTGARRLFTRTDWKAEAEWYQQMIAEGRRATGYVPDKAMTDKKTGSVYAFELDGRVKIGSAKNPERRIQTWKHQLVDYTDSKIGRTWYLSKVNNFREKEKQIHSILEDYRKPKTELFDISFEDAVNLIKKVCAQ